MKKHIIYFLLITPLYLSAQGTGGFFDQQSSKAKLMLAQIAGYQTYLHDIKTGYRIAENGLNTVSDLKRGSFDRHSIYYNSLQQVNPVIKNNARAKEIIDMQHQVIRLFDTEMSWQQKQQILAVTEINYIRSVYKNLLQKSQTDLDELNQVLTPGKLQLTDQQRLDRVDHLYAAMQDKLAFAQSFTNHCRQLATERKKDRLDNEQLKKLYGLP